MRNSHGVSNRVPWMDWTMSPKPPCSRTASNCTRAKARRCSAFGISRSGSVFENISIGISIGASLVSAAQLSVGRAWRIAIGSTRLRGVFSDFIHRRRSRCSSRTSHAKRDITKRSSGGSKMSSLKAGLQPSIWDSPVAVRVESALPQEAKCRPVRKPGGVFMTIANKIIRLFSSWVFCLGF